MDGDEVAVCWPVTLTVAGFEATSGDDVADRVCGAHLVPWPCRFTPVNVERVSACENDG